MDVCGDEMICDMHRFQSMYVILYINNNINMMCK